MMRAQRRLLHPCRAWALPALALALWLFTHTSLR